MASNKSLCGAIKTKIKRTKRETPPAHYVLKIESFTDLLEILSETVDQKYESDEFEAGDYKWKLVVYPNGNKERNGDGHISMYIASADKKAISCGCQVNALVSFFVYDHIRDKYLTVQDGKIKRYHVSRTEHGFDQMISLDKFNDLSSGYLANDCCVFGVEVHVIKNTVHGTAFSVIKDPSDSSFSWKIDKFSALQNESQRSDAFTVGGYKWKLQLHPKGFAEERERSLSLFLELDIQDCAKNSQRVYAECKMMIKDQIQGNHKERTFGNNWFTSLRRSWGYRSSMPLSDLKNEAKGFLVDDTLVVEAEIIRVSAVRDLS